MHTPGRLLLFQIGFELGEYDIDRMAEMPEDMLLEWVCFFEWRDGELEKARKKAENARK